MVIIAILIVSFLSSLLGKYLFKKWLNHLTVYSVIWGFMLFLFELRFLPYQDLKQITWYFILASYISFLFGTLTVFAARKLYNKPNVFAEKLKIDLSIFVDNGKTVKYLTFFFSTLCLIAALQNWDVLLNMYGSISAVLLNANKTYQLSTRGAVKGVIPYISFIGYVAIFFSAIYTAYKGRFSLLTFFPFIGILLKEIAIVGRAGMLFALLEFIFSFFLFRHLLRNDSKDRFRFSKSNAIVATSILIIFFVFSASLVRLSRGANESYKGASSELRGSKENIVLSPSLYLYLSSDIGVLNHYLMSGGEDTGFGYNTFLSAYNLLAKFGVVERTSDFQKGYYIPMWTNTGTYIRELHADFGDLGVFIGPYILGLLITFLWFRFYESKKTVLLVLLVYLYLIVGFSFLVIVTRLLYWILTLVFIVCCVYLLEKKSKLNLSLNHLGSGASND